jgi:hypothetical protein
MLGPTQSAAVLELERRMSMNDRVATVAEPAMTLVSSMIAEPLSGLAGIAGTLLPGPQGQGAEWVNDVQEALTYVPRTEHGQRALSGLAGLMQPVGDALLAAEEYSGGIGYDFAGPIGGAMMAAIPAAALEVTGMGRPVRALKHADVFSELAKAEDLGGSSAVRNLASEIISERPDLKSAVYDDYVNMGYDPSELLSPETKPLGGMAIEPESTTATATPSIISASEDITPEVARSFFDSDAIPDGWMVHGRHGRQDLDTGNVIQLSQDWGVAESYGKNGSMWMIKESSPESLLDLSSQNTDDMAKVVERAIQDYKEGALPWADDIYQAIGREPTVDDIELAVRSEFAPENIVDSARAFDNEDWVSWLADSFEDKAIIKTPDGGVVLDPSKVKKVKVGD